MQQEIDRGLQHCAPCDQFGANTFCGECGRRYRGADLEWRECPQCKATVTSQYCPRCGEQVWSEYLKRWESGQIDLAAEGRRARRILERMVARNPQLAQELNSRSVGGPGLPPPSDRDLVSAINAGFGRR